MCIISLTSNHNKFSWIIGKNPNTSIVVKSVRHGNAYGYYDVNSDNKTYIIYFLDSSTEMSYKEHNGQHFEYLNTLQYSSPVCIINLLSEFLRSSLYEKYNDEVLCENKIFCNLVKIEKRSVTIINKILVYFPNISMKLTNKELDVYSVDIQCNNLYFLMHFTNMIFIILSYMGTNDLYVDNHLIQKMINSMCELNAPYFVRYLISSRILNKKLYDHVKDLICTSPSHSYTINFGNTEDHRIKYIKEHLDKNQCVLDFGCGEGTYVKAFAPFIKNEYIAFDIDENEIQKVFNKIKLHKLDNVTPLTSYNDVISKCNNLENMFVIVSEVVEHMELNESRLTISNLIKDINFEKLIITTPNYDFNQFYIMEHKFRHHDHKLEFTPEEFKKYFDDIINTNVYDKKFTYEYVCIGDIVDGISCSQGIILTTNT